MSTDLSDHIGRLDHGRLADLVGDVRIVELVDEMMANRGQRLRRGQLVLDILGGPAAVLDNPKTRKALMISLSVAQEAQLRNRMGVDDLYGIRMSAKRREILYDFFGVALPPKQTVTKELSATGIGVSYGLFPYQSIALLESWSHLRSGGSVMLHMPTGAGKTRTAMHLIARHLNSHESSVVVWLVSGKELCEQAAEEFSNAWKALGERPIPLIKIWDGRRGVDAESFENCYRGSGRDTKHLELELTENIWPETLRDGMVIASLESIGRLFNQWQPGEAQRRREHIKLIVFDEAHRSVAPTYLRAIKNLSWRTGLLGLTATPGRRHHGHRSESEVQLVALFTGNKVVLSIPGYASPVEALVAQGYLAKMTKERLAVANGDLSLSDIREIQAKLENSLDLDDGTLRRFGLNATRNLQIVNKVSELIDEGHRRVIVFAPSVESSDLIANILTARDIASYSVTVRTAPHIRNDSISLYRRDDNVARVLCNFRVLTTGFDAPQTSAVVIGRPTTSIVLLSQMAGRAIRGPKMGGTQESTLVTVVDTAVPELVDTISQFHAFDEAWATTGEEK